jgi:hypothetical protein
VGHQFQGAVGTHPKSCVSPSRNPKRPPCSFWLTRAFLQYAEFGLEYVCLSFFLRDSFLTNLLSSHSHFGTDTAGINTTRRYLCEALSFHYRYVPIGLLEVLPPRVNDRSPLFRGRDELGGCLRMLSLTFESRLLAPMRKETLLASGDSRDWVKISEMFLGPAPESWTFTPKHKSNAHGGEEGQG